MWSQDFAGSVGNEVGHLVLLFFYFAVFLVQQVVLSPALSVGDGGAGWAVQGEGCQGVPPQHTL